jgi:hypothetical protein
MSTVIDVITKKETSAKLDNILIRILILIPEDKVPTF